jgi:hypothetical protein
VVVLSGDGVDRPYACVNVFWRAEGPFHRGGRGVCWMEASVSLQFRMSYADHKCGDVLTGSRSNRRYKHRRTAHHT